MTSQSLEDARSALAEAEGWLRPASMEALARVLGELYLRTARRAEESIDRQAVVMLYARELTAYPRDIALDAIRRYRGKFFPALDELREPIERDARLIERRQRIAALKGLVENWRKPSMKKRGPITDDQKRRMTELIDELSDQANKTKPHTDGDLAALDRVDQVFGKSAINPRNPFKSIDAIRREDAMLERYRKCTQTIE